MVHDKLYRPVISQDLDEESEEDVPEEEAPEEKGGGWGEEVE